MGDLMPWAGVIGLVAIFMVLALAALAYWLSPAFRFWFFDIWADLPLIGTVARLSHMSMPTNKKANERLKKLFRAYHNHIRDPLPEKDFNRIRQYLFLAGDSDSRPTPVFALLFLVVLLIAEAFTFSFLLGISISPDISQNQANFLAIGLAFITAAVLARLSHPAGHAIKRTKALRTASRQAIDPDQELPDGEKKMNELRQRVSLEEEQDCDKPRVASFDSQRLLNRVQKMQNDRGSYLLPVLFIIAIAIIGILQFQLRYASGIVSEALNLPGAESGLDQAAPVWANGFFVILFFLTQGLALLLGYQFGFLGRDSERAFRIIGGRDSYQNYRDENDDKIARADESLNSLFDKMKNRYDNVNPDAADYRQRVKREKQAQEEKHPDQGPPPDEPSVSEAGSSDTDDTVVNMPTNRKDSAA